LTNHQAASKKTNTMLQASFLQTALSRATYADVEVL